MLNIVFMGTPDFAVPSLELIHSRFNLLAVVTATDKPGGRGHALIESPIKKWGLLHNIQVLQPANLKSSKFVESLRSLGADLFVVVAFRMLPKEIWSMPSKGTINLHASLLPEFRGAAPIQRAIMSGAKRTGLTTFKLMETIDTGDILNNLELSIGEDETGGELHDRMMTEGSKLLLDSLEKIEAGNEKYTSQKSQAGSQAPKLFKEDGEINWNTSVHKVYDHIRALIPYPGSWCVYENKMYKILSARKILLESNQKPGSWEISKSSLLIYCQQGAIEVLKIQPAGKKIMDIKDFLNGIKPILG